MRILVATDDRATRDLVVSGLRDWGYHPVLAESEEAARAELNPETRLGLVDAALAGAAEVCRRAREGALRYVVALAATDQERTALLAAGADDLIGRPPNLLELKARLATGRRLLELDQARHFHASHDPLTGIWNRGAILEALQRELDRGAREKAPVGVILADLDDFQAVNQRHGPLVGDEVLKEIVRRLRAAGRPYDSIGRYGEEEFLVALPGCNAAGALTMANRIREGVGGLAIEAAQHVIPMTMCLGATAGGEGSKASPADLIRAADAALQRAKRTGRNRAEAATMDDLR